MLGLLGRGWGLAATWLVLVLVWLYVAFVVGVLAVVGLVVLRWLAGLWG